MISSLSVSLSLLSKSNVTSLVPFLSYSSSSGRFVTAVRVPACIRSIADAIWKFIFLPADILVLKNMIRYSRFQTIKLILKRNLKLLYWPLSQPLHPQEHHIWWHKLVVYQAVKRLNALYTRKCPRLIGKVQDRWLYKNNQFPYWAVAFPRLDAIRNCGYVCLSSFLRSPLRIFQNWFLLSLV